MFDNDRLPIGNLSRRNVLKVAAATGTAALGVGATSGSAAAQIPVDVDADNIVQGNNLVSVVLEGTEVPTTAENIDVSLLDLTGELLGIEIEAGDVVVIDGNTVVVIVEIPIQELLNVDVSEVIFDVEVLSASDEILATGVDTSRVIELAEEGGEEEEGGEKEESEGPPEETPGEGPPEETPGEGPPSSE